MSEYLKKQAKKHKVTHEFSGKQHFFKVESDSKETYNVSIQVNCDCRYFSVQGSPNGLICSHVLAVLEKIVDDGEVNSEY